MKPADTAPATFREFEHRAWQSVVKLYEDYFGALTAQCIEPLLDAVNVHAGDALLDIATGPGYIAAAAARRGAKVTGLDFSSAMIAEASALHPDISFREGDAGNLPFADASFDVVVIGFGILHFPDPDRALREAFRALRSSGPFRPRRHPGIWPGSARRRNAKPARMRVPTGKSNCPCPPWSPALAKARSRFDAAGRSASHARRALASGSPLPVPVPGRAVSRAAPRLQYPELKAIHAIPRLPPGVGPLIALSCRNAGSTASDSITQGSRS